MRLGTRAVAFIIPALLVAAFAFFAFFRPEPNEDLEYLAREDAVLVQMISVGGLPQPEVLDRLTLPDFTLYGDGTVLYADPSGEEELLQAEIPGGAIQDLLESFEGEGFFEFQYEQPTADSVNDADTTYLYAQTKDAANAVSAYALGVFNPPDGSEWREFERLAKLKEWLDAFDPEGVGGRVVGPYEATEIALMAEPIDGDDTGAVPWPVDEINLASMRPAEGSNVAVRYIPLDEASEAIAALPSRFAIVSLRDASYRVGYRQALPFEEHFPEFDFAG